MKTSLTALALASLALAAQAQNVNAARAAQISAKAETHVKQFAGRSLHANDHSYELRDIVADADGSTHTRFDRRIAGLRVIGGDLVVQQDRFGNMAEIHKSASRLPAIDTSPALPKGRAISTAAKLHAGSVDTDPELVV
jgi:Zn-dependent metalloprotease